jgi:hypothetical protein
MEISVPNGKSSTKLLLRGVLHAPSMGLTIVSVGRLDEVGYGIFFRGNTCRIYNDSKKIIGQIPAATNRLYRVEHGDTVSHSTDLSPLEELHRKLGHIAPKAVKRLVKEGIVEGVKLDGSEEMGLCDSCEYAKMTRKPIKKERREPRAEKFGDEIHSDVWGPSTTQTKGGRKYYVSFTDDSTRYSHVELLKKKSDSFDAYKNFEAWVKTQHDAKIKRLRSDRGGEFTSDEFAAHLRSQGTEQRLTTHDTPEHNGIAEALNRRLLERVRAMLHQSALPKFLWGEAILHATYLKNRTATFVLGDKTPYEALTGKKPNISNLPEWGTRVWVHDPTGSKLAGRSRIGRWVGFDTESPHAHRIYWPDRQTVGVERSVKFDDREVYIPPVPTAKNVSVPIQGESTKATTSKTIPTTSETNPERDIIDNNPTRRSPTPIPDNTITPPTRPSTPTNDNTNNLPPNAEDDYVSAKRVRKPSAYVERLLAGEGHTGGLFKNRKEVGPTVPGGIRIEGETGAMGDVGKDEEDWVLRDLEYAMGAVTGDAEGLDPQSLAEAKRRSDWPLWKEAMQKEMDTLRKAETWIVVDKPPGKNIVGSKWVFRLKKNSDGQIEKYKARLVARGFTQIHGVDYTETFAPVAKMSSLRTVLAIAAQRNWPIEVFDFNGAYLNGILDDTEEIYMEQPPEYESGPPGSVLRLRKTLYGLKQSGRTWYETMRRAFGDLDLKRAESDFGVFYFRKGPHIIILAIHVDDCTITGTSQSLLDDYKRRINAVFTMTDLGPISWLLGIEVKRDRQNRTISLCQKSYIESILARFGLEDAKPLAIPMDVNISFSKDQCPTTPEAQALMRRVPYREAVGSLMYAAIGTRPDISFAVSTLSQFLENPGQVHWEAVKRVFRYLLGTKDWRLRFGGGKEGLEGFTDADGASQEHRRAISGHAFLINGGAVSWSSRKQELVTLSTAEAEYVAATHAAKEAIWLRRFIGELFSPISTPTTLYCDNQAAVALASNGNYHARTKHIDIRYHFIRFVVEDGSIKLIYCPTDEMTADTLTKALPSPKAKHFAAALGLCHD